MSYCSKCGVKLEENKKFCPLCHFKVPEELIKEIEYKFPVAKTSYKKRVRKRKFKLVIITSIIFILLILTFFVSDISTSHQFSWSKPADISLTLVWIGILIALFYTKGKEYWISTQYFVLIVLFFVLLDLKDGVFNIQLTFELTLLIFFYVFTLVAIYFYKRLGVRNIFLVGALYLIMAQILIFFVDVTVGIYLYERFRFTFSIYTLIPLLGLFALCLYFHHDMAEELKESMKKKLHF